MSIQLSDGATSSAPPALHLEHEGNSVTFAVVDIDPNVPDTEWDTGEPLLNHRGEPKTQIVLTVLVTAVDGATSGRQDERTPAVVGNVHSIYISRYAKYDPDEDAKGGSHLSWSGAVASLATFADGRRRRPVEVPRSSFPAVARSRARPGQVCAAWHRSPTRQTRRPAARNFMQGWRRNRSTPRRTSTKKRSDLSVPPRLTVQGRDWLQCRVRDHETPGALDPPSPPLAPPLRMAAVQHLQRHLGRRRRRTLPLVPRTHTTMGTGQRMTNYIGRHCPVCTTDWNGPADEDCPTCGWSSTITRKRSQQQIEADETRQAEEDELAQSWAGMDLTDAVNGQRDDPPTILERTDGKHLIYAGRVSWISGEPEAMKSMVAQYAVVQVLTAGGRVLYIDYEDTETSVVGRLQAMGAPNDAILERLVYLRPETPIGPGIDRITTAETIFNATVKDGDLRPRRRRRRHRIHVDGRPRLQLRRRRRRLVGPHRPTHRTHPHRRHRPRPRHQEHREPRTLRHRLQPQTRSRHRSRHQPRSRPPTLPSRHRTRHRQIPHDRQQGPQRLGAPSLHRTQTRRHLRDHRLARRRPHTQHHHRHHRTHATTSKSSSAVLGVAAYQFGGEDTETHLIKHTVDYTEAEVVSALAWLLDKEWIAAGRKGNSTIYTVTDTGRKEA